ncbi:MAG: hypothetical protein LBI60_03255 [Bacteroidales bacterium]|nr:hypothetical protein [Bacteroidales bacterium]
MYEIKFVFQNDFMATQDKRIDKEKEITAKKYDKALPVKQNVNFLDCCQSHIDTYKKKDIRIMEASFKRFKDFLSLSYPNMQKILKLFRDIRAGENNYENSMNIQPNNQTVEKCLKQRTNTINGKMPLSVLPLRMSW